MMGTPTSPISCPQQEDPSPKLHDGLPITGYHRGEAIPDLGRIPQDRWREVLRPLGCRYTRQLTWSTVATQQEVIAVGILVGELLTEGRPAVLLRPPSMIPAVPICRRDLHGGRSTSDLARASTLGLAKPRGCSGCAPTCWRASW